MTFRLSTALALLNKPHLITPDAASEIARRIRALDARAFERASGPFALLRKVGLAGKGKPRALEGDDEHLATPLPTRPNAYVPAWMGEPDFELEWGAAVKDGVAMLEVRGPLAERGEYFCGEWFHGYDTISAAIAEMDAERDVRGIIVRFDTPGGVVASGIYDLAAELQGRAPDAKPLWAHCEMACSAGYWIASQFDRVLAPRAGLVGSIGAVMVHESYAGALEKAGIAVEAIQFGASKTDGAWWKALSEVARADLQAMIDEIGVTFCNTVAAGRAGKLSAEQARATEARVFSAEHSDPARSALALGLIDGVMSEREAFEAMKAEIAPKPFAIPATAGSPAARAAQPKPAAVAGPTLETDMKLRAAIKAALDKPGAKTSDEKLDEIRKILDEEEETAEGDDEKPDAEGDEDEPAAEEGDEEDTSASAALGRAQAILALPEAKGREALAQQLAFDPAFAGVDVAKAKATLAKAPLASRMAGNVIDPKISAVDATDNRSEGRKVADEALALAGLTPKAQ